MNRKKIERYFDKRKKRVDANHEKGKCGCGAKKGLMMMGSVILCKKCLEQYKHDCEKHGLPELVPPPEMLKDLIDVNDLKEEK